MHKNNDAEMKKIGRQEIETYYDTTKSVKENIAMMSKNGFQVSKDTLYRYCKEKGISTKSSKETICKDAKELVDPSLTSKENQKKLYTDYGINIPLEKINKFTESGANRISEELEASVQEVTEPVAEENRFGQLSPKNQKIVDDYLEYVNSGGWNKDYLPF